MITGQRGLNAPRSVDAWPGWVDALSSLVMVIIFMLMIFVVAQFYLTAQLSGRDEQLGRLNAQVAELAEMLDLERLSGAELEDRLNELSTDFQSAVAERDRLAGDLAALQTERQSLADQLAAALDRARTLEADAATVDAGLADAFATIEVDQETIELQLREIASLQNDIQALRGVRDDLELQVAALELARQDAEERAAATGVELEAVRGQVADLNERLGLSDAEAQRLREQLAARDQQLQSRTQELAALDQQLQSRTEELAARDQELQSRTQELAARNQELQIRTQELATARTATDEVRVELNLTAEARDRLLAELTAARDRSQALEAELSDAQERTVLAQREIEARDIRIEELVAAVDTTEAALTEEQTLTSQSRARIALLNRQITTLREQLARLESALRVSESEVSSQDVEIVNLNARLNQALVREVEELNRYRSEFFGRLREAIGDREDIRVVGDRFVFQSEVLFPTASATLEASGRPRLAELADTLMEIAAGFPPEIDWVLRVDGHTDRRPISTPNFPSNWELSTARAIEVVKFLIQEGVPPERLAAAGFADNQPLDPALTETAFERNRRIELKLDQR